MTASRCSSCIFWLAALLLFCLSPTPTAADNDTNLGAPTPIVLEVIEAANAKSQAVLQKMVESKAHDPWFTAHELCLRGHRQAARAFAQATDRKDLTGLKAYVSTLSRSPPRKDVYLRHREALIQMQEERWHDLRTAFESRPVSLSAQSVIEADIEYILGRALNELGREDAALQRLERAGTTAMRLGWWRGAYNSWQLYFQIARERHDARAMLTANRKLLEVFQFQGNRRMIGATLSDQGSILGNLGNYGGALQHFTQAADEYGDDLSPGQHLHVMVSIGMVHSFMGHYAEAESRFRSALAGVVSQRRALREQTPVPEKKLRGMTEIDVMATEHLGMLSAAIGAYEQAERLLQHARELTVALGDEQWEAEIRGNLATVAMKQGRFEVAMIAFRELIDFYEQTGQVDYALTASSNIAEIDRKQGRIDQALRRQKVVMRGHEARGRPPELAYSYGELALLYQMKEQYQLALDYRGRQLELAREMADLDAEVAAMAGLAEAHNAGNNHKAALKIAREAAGKLSYVFDRLSPMRAATARGKTVDVYRAGLEAALALGSVEDVSHFLEGARAGALLVAMDGGDRIRTANIPAELRAQAVAARMAEALAHRELMAARKAGNIKKTKAANERYEQAGAVHRGVVDRILLESSIAADLVYPTPASLSEIQATLEADEVLVVYGVARDRLIALRITRKLAKVVDLAAAADVHAQCLALRKSMAARTSAIDVEELRKHLAQPLSLAAGVRRVLISPVGCLAYMPMGLVFPKHEVALVQSGTTLIKLKALPTVTKGAVLALGDPSYGHVPTDWDDAPAVRSGRLTPLPGTREEARAVGDTVLLGDEASETRLRAELEKLVKSKPLRGLHLACHGLVNEERPSSSALAMTPSDEDDGLLTTQDVFQMKVPADLVVLSACDTGRGKLMQAEGIFGLTRAFMAAGSKRVLVSLWKVDDEASRALMIRFHQLWNAKDPKKRLSASAALRSAQIHVRTHPKHPEWKHPHYWAAWQLWGPPR